MIHPARGGPATPPGLWCHAKQAGHLRARRRRRWTHSLDALAGRTRLSAIRVWEEFQPAKTCSCHGDYRALLLLLPLLLRHNVAAQAAHLPRSRAAVPFCAQSSGASACAISVHILTAPPNRTELSCPSSRASLCVRLKRGTISAKTCLPVVPARRVRTQWDGRAIDCNPICLTRRQRLEVALKGGDGQCEGTKGRAWGGPLPLGLW